MDEASSNVESEILGYGGPTGITVDKSVEFSYEELAAATNNFSMANKIGQGGFGAVYYAELRGEVVTLTMFWLVNDCLVDVGINLIICFSHLRLKKRADLL